jgi:hypothetical protein
VPRSPKLKPHFFFVPHASLADVAEEIVDRRHLTFHRLVVFPASPVSRTKFSFDFASMYLSAGAGLV